MSSSLHKIVQVNISFQKKKMETKEFFLYKSSADEYGVRRKSVKLQTIIF